MKYFIDYESCDFAEGGAAQFYSIIGMKGYGFKEYGGKNAKRDAKFAWSTQKKLARFGLAPKVIGPIQKIDAHYMGKMKKSNWGYITQIARLQNYTEKYTYKSLQNLVEKIREKTGLKFWDSHFENIGFITIKGKTKLVCIDTGRESFDRDCNAWGFREPGPKCVDCNKYQCSCCDY